MSLTIASGRDVRNVSSPRLADSATRTVAPHSSSIARITSRVSSSSSTTSTVVPSSSMGDRCTPSALHAVWENFFRRNVDARTHEETRATSVIAWRAKSGLAFSLRARGGRRCPMKSSRTILVVIVVILAAHAAAIAGPGDPRLVNGVLEWPRALTNEPFVVVRGDDGALYYVTITAARRDATLAGGARVAVLGLEGRTSHEITALGVGVGDSAESALANLQGAKSTSAAPAPPPAAAAAAVVMPPSGAAPTPPSAPSPTATSSATPAHGGAAAIAAPSAKAPAAPTAGASTPGAPTPTPNATTPGPGSNAAAPTTPAPAVTPTTPGVGPYPAIISAPTPAPAPSAAVQSPPQPKQATPEVTPASTPMPSLARDDRRWTEITGVVEAVSGRTLVLRSSEGRVAVDISSLSSTVDRIVTPGSTVRVYGLPIEVRFKAM